jgi:hypothetical protein
LPTVSSDSQLFLQTGKKFELKKLNTFRPDFKPQHMANEFKPTVGKQVLKADAEKWIEKFDKERKKDTKSVFFGRDVLLRALSTPGASGLSFMFARKLSEGQGKDADDLVIVPTTEDGTLLWTSDQPTLSSDTSGSSTYNAATTCPPYCPK